VISPSTLASDVSALLEEVSLPGSTSDVLLKASVINPLVVGWQRPFSLALGQLQEEDNIWKSWNFVCVYIVCVYMAYLPCVSVWG